MNFGKDVFWHISSLPEERVWGYSVASGIATIKHENYMLLFQQQRMKQNG